MPARVNLIALTLVVPTTPRKKSISKCRIQPPPVNRGEVSIAHHPHVILRPFLNCRNYLDILIYLVHDSGVDVKVDDRVRARTLDQLNMFEGLLDPNILCRGLTHQYFIQERTLTSLGPTPMCSYLVKYLVKSTVFPG